MDVEAKFNEFLLTCSDALRSQDEPIEPVMSLIKRRFEQCQLLFRSSDEMKDLLDSTMERIKQNSQMKTFVHLRDFVAQLRLKSSAANRECKKRKPLEPLEVIAKLPRLLDNASDSSDSELGLKRVAGEDCSSTAHNTGSSLSSAMTQEDEKGDSQVPFPSLLGCADEPLPCRALPPAPTADPFPSPCSSSHLCEDGNTGSNSSAGGGGTSNTEQCVASNAETEVTPVSTMTGTHAGGANGDPGSRESQTGAACCDERAGCVSGDQIRISSDVGGDNDGANVELPSHSVQAGSDDAFSPSQKESDRIRKLEKYLEQIRNKIERVRNLELSLADLQDENSAYMYEDRLKRKLVKVWEKLCSLHRCSPLTGRVLERKIGFRGTRFPEVNRRIQRFVNRDGCFPDFHDILGIVGKANVRFNLGLRDCQVTSIAQEAFVDVGEALQRRRHLDFISTFRSSQVMDYRAELDPALHDEDLRRKLGQNRALAKSNMDEAVQKYAELQLSLGVTEDVENTVDVENTGHVENTEDDNAGETKMFGHLTVDNTRPHNTLGHRSVVDGARSHDDLIRRQHKSELSSTAVSPVAALTDWSSAHSGQVCGLPGTGAMDAASWGAPSSAAGRHPGSMRKVSGVPFDDDERGGVFWPAGSAPKASYADVGCGWFGGSSDRSTSAAPPQSIVCKGHVMHVSANIRLPLSLAQRPVNRGGRVRSKCPRAAATRPVTVVPGDDEVVCISSSDDDESDVTGAVRADVVTVNGFLDVNTLPCHGIAGEVVIVLSD